MAGKKVTHLFTPVTQIPESFSAVCFLDFHAMLIYKAYALGLVLPWIIIFFPFKKIWKDGEYLLWLQWSKFLKACIQRNFAKRPRFGIHKLSYMIQKFHLIIKFKNPPITYKFPKLNLPKNIHFNLNIFNLNK